MTYIQCEVDFLLWAVKAAMCFKNKYLQFNYLFHLRKIIVKKFQEIHSACKLFDIDNQKIVLNLLYMYFRSSFIQNYQTALINRIMNHYC